MPPAIKQFASGTLSEVINMSGFGFPKTVAL